MNLPLSEYLSYCYGVVALDSVRGYELRGSRGDGDSKKLWGL